MIKRLLFRIARSRVAAYFIGFAFAHLTRWMPIKRIMENEAVIVFEHPKPFWETHWLAVPKRHVPSIAKCERQTLLALLPIIQRAAARLTAPVMLVNAGKYQDVPQLHFHITSGPDVYGGVWGNERFAGDATGELFIATHPEPSRDVHWQIHAPSLPTFGTIDWSDQTQANAAINAVLAAQTQATMLQLDAYSILWHLAETHFTLYLVSGNRT